MHCCFLFLHLARAYYYSKSLVCALIFNRRLPRPHRPRYGGQGADGRPDAWRRRRCIIVQWVTGNEIVDVPQAADEDLVGINVNHHARPS